MLEATLAKLLKHGPNISSFSHVATKHTTSRITMKKTSQIKGVVLEEGNAYTSFVFNHISNIALNI